MPKRKSPPEPVPERARITAFYGKKLDAFLAQDEQSHRCEKPVVARCDPGWVPQTLDEALCKPIERHLLR